MNVAVTYKKEDQYLLDKWFLYLKEYDELFIKNYTGKEEECKKLLLDDHGRTIITNEITKIKSMIIPEAITIIKDV